MIVGIGIDVVDIVFAPSARSRGHRPSSSACSPRANAPPCARSLAARFAAKESIKALGGHAIIRWHEMRRIVQDPGNPDFELSGGSPSTCAGWESTACTSR